jgi:starch synthase
VEISAPKKVLFTASEIAPLAKTGGLADVAAALPGHLRRLGWDVRPMMPLYSLVDREAHGCAPLDIPQPFAVPMGGRSYDVSLWTARLPGGPEAYLVECPELYDRPAIYTDEADEPHRFALLSAAAIEACRRLDWAPDIFHCNDWHTSLIPALLDKAVDRAGFFCDSRSILTIHNIGYQGIFSADLLEELGLSGCRSLLDLNELEEDRIGFLRTGLANADAVTTVSPTYAEEIQTDEYGMGLEDVLRERRADLTGILNGVDYDEWSPERDGWIPHHYSRSRLEGKSKNKAYLLEWLGLTGEVDAPLLGIVSRLARQKGFELCYEVLPEQLRATDLRIVVLGEGEAEYEEFFSRLARSFPGRAFHHGGYSDELAHLIEAAADIFLMPSRYEPCGLNQMFSLRYGTIPIVRKTGGLADSVEHFDPESGEGTGFVFEHFTPEGLRWALELALSTYRNPEAWGQLMNNAMTRNFSWEVQARKYIDLYTEIIRRDG